MIRAALLSNFQRDAVDDGVWFREWDAMAEAAQATEAAGGDDASLRV
jgi:hypothetical protein